MRLATTMIGIVSLGLAALGGATTREYDEQYRPQYHFSPPAQWMNDPNGLVFLDGEYHLFYQYNPNSTVWGPMHWGHAVSRDLVHWVNLPIALYPDDLGTIFSGSAVYDEHNTSGLGSTVKPPLVAIFTNHNHAAETSGRNDFQNQSLAYSLDKGRSWTKYAGNPVLKNPGSRDFRDPKVSWFEPGKKWIMTLAVRDHVAFFSSPDLKNWVHESDFGQGQGSHGGVWECPDLIQLRIDGGTGSKHVLLVSVNPGGPNGGSATQYFVGAFDGHAFKPDPDVAVRPPDAQSGTPPPGTAPPATPPPGTPPLWVDYGTDDYAGVTWSGIPGRQVFLGWMSNWVYARTVPSVRWRSAMTLPRDLSLVRTARGLELRSTPIVELAALRTSTTPIAKQDVRGDVDLTRAAPGNAGTVELELDLDLKRAAMVTLEFANAAGQKTLFRINQALRRYELDRSQSGAVDFDPHFGATQFAPMPMLPMPLPTPTSTQTPRPLAKAAAEGSANATHLRIFLDRSSIEVFINHGETVLTAIDFPSTPYTHIVLQADQPVKLTSGVLHTLRSIWTDGSPAR